MVIRKDPRKFYETDALDLSQLLMGAEQQTVMCYHENRLIFNRRGGIDAAHEPLVVPLQTMVIQKALENETRWIPWICRSC